MIDRNGYLENEILQADPLKLVQLLYRGAIDAAGRASACLVAGDIAGRGRHVSKAIEIVTELMLSVDRERGGEVAANLIELYDYVLRKLAAAHAEQSAARLEEAVQVLRTLLVGWEEIGAASAPAVSGVPQEAAGYLPVSVSF